MDWDSTTRSNSFFVVNAIVDDILLNSKVDAQDESACSFLDVLDFQSTPL